MTRINVAIPPKVLVKAHLIAEHREIIRIPNNVRQGKVNMDNIPSKFTLGTGHVKFFYNKLGYLLNRYKEIYAECINRGFNVQNYENCWDSIPIQYMGNYIPTAADRLLLENRIAEKLDGMGFNSKKWRELLKQYDYGI